MTTKHEAALRALEELESRARTGIWSAGKPGTNVSNWQLAATIRDALTAQGEALEAAYQAGLSALDEPSFRPPALRRRTSAPPAWRDE